MISGFNSVPVENSPGAFTVGGRALAFHLGSAMRKPVLGGAVRGLGAGCPFASHPKIDNLSHAATRGRQIVGA